MPIPIVIGYNLVERPDARQGLTLPPPDGRLAADNIEGRKASQLKKLDEKFYPFAAQAKITGRVGRIFAVAIETGQVFDTQDPEFQVILDHYGVRSPAAAFVAWLLDMNPAAFSSWPTDRNANDDFVFYGFDLKPFLRVAGIEARLDDSPSITVPVGFWYRDDSVFDPYEMVVEKDYRDYIGLDKVCSRLGLPLPPDDYVVGNDAMLDALLAGTLVMRLSLAPSDQTAGLRKFIQERFVERPKGKAAAPAAPTESTAAPVAAKPEKNGKREKKSKS